MDTWGDLGNLLPAEKGPRTLGSTGEYWPYMLSPYLGLFLAIVV